METRLITLTKENLLAEHICCCLGDKKSIPGVMAKKDWMRERMNEGLKFVKADVRGKVFIEYIPVENGWMPVNAPGYTLINCLWVAGSFKGQGYGKQLLNFCEKDSSEKNGVIIIVAKKKRPFLADKAFFLKQGYEVCDSANPDFELLVKRFKPDAVLPRFRQEAKEGMPSDIKGIDIFYTHQCPYNPVYIQLIKPVIMESDIPIRTHQIRTKEEAQIHFCPVTSYSVFVNGQYYTNAVLTVPKLRELVNECSSI